MKYVKPDYVTLKNHSAFNERWVQARLAEDPSLLGLGDLVLKDKERPQPHAGRLDLLFQDADANKRYEVEIQLGRTDEAHIIRTIEYWDVERRRYPQYEHTAVIVAEDITSRFLSVISLFNGAIPLVALQMRAVHIGEHVSLLFTTVLNEVNLGLVDEDEELVEVTDRSYWERRAAKATLEVTDNLAGLVTELDPGLSLKYNKFYIGLAKNDQPNNFVIFKPKKESVRIEPRLERSDEVSEKLEASGLEVLGYDGKWGRYRIRLAPDDFKASEPVLRDLFRRAYDGSRA